MQVPWLYNLEDTVFPRERIRLDRWRKGMSKGKKVETQAAKPGGKKKGSGWRSIKGRFGRKK